MSQYNARYDIIASVQIHTQYNKGTVPEWHKKERRTRFFPLKSSL